MATFPTKTPKHIIRYVLVGPLNTLAVQWFCAGHVRDRWILGSQEFPCHATYKSASCPSNYAVPIKFCMEGRGICRERERSVLTLSNPWPQAKRLAAKHHQTTPASHEFLGQSLWEPWRSPPSQEASPIVRLTSAWRIAVLLRGTGQLHRFATSDENMLTDE